MPAIRLEDVTTLKDIARKESVNYHTLRRWLNKTNVRQEKKGTVIFIKKSDVSKILAAGTK